MTHPLSLTLLRARAEAAAGRFDDALRILGHAVRSDPRSGDVWFEIGVVLGLEGDHEQACEAFEHVLDLDPTSGAAHFQKGLHLLALGRASDAHASFARSLELGPEYARTGSRSS